MLIRPSTTSLSLGINRKGSNPPARSESYSRKDASTSYEPISAPFAQPQWDTNAVALPTAVTNALENQARAAYESAAC